MYCSLLNSVAVFFGIHSRFIRLMLLSRSIVVLYCMDLPSDVWWESFRILFAPIASFRLHFSSFDGWLSQWNFIRWIRYCNIFAAWWSNINFAPCISACHKCSARLLFWLSQKCFAPNARRGRCVWVFSLARIKMLLLNPSTQICW